MKRQIAWNIFTFLLGVFATIAVLIFIDDINNEKEFQEFMAEFRREQAERLHHEIPVSFPPTVMPASILDEPVLGTPSLPKDQPQTAL